MSHNFKNPVIFLDVDGVLTSDRCFLVYDIYRKPLWDAWDPVAVEALWQVGNAGVKFVISSTWRFHKDELDAKLNQNDLMQFVRQPNWRTGDLRLEGKVEPEALRGQEIAAYLKDNPDIDAYRIIDDTKDFLPEQEKYLIHTDMDNGMTNENLRKLLRWAGVMKA